MSNPYPTFGRSSSITPMPANVRGENGWWVVPPGWFMKSNPQCPSETIASPNADFSKPVYYCTLADDMQSMAFQDMMLLKQTGQDNPYGTMRPI